jgi:hypothetical protein
MADENPETSAALSQMARAISDLNINIKKLVPEGKNTKDVRFDPDNVEDFEDALTATLNEIKKGTPFLKQFTGVIKGQKQPLDDYKHTFESLSKALEDQEKIIQSETQKNAKIRADGTATATQKEISSQSIIEAEKKKMLIEEKGRAMAGAVAAQALQTSMLNAAVAAGNFIGAMIDNSLEFASGLQNGTEGTKLYADASINATKATAKLTGELADIAEGLGAVLIGLGLFNPPLLIAGIALEALGLAADKSAKAIELYAKGQRILSDEVEKTKKSFREITATGAEFAGGMTEMRQHANVAGIGVAEFATVIKAATPELANMGGGIADSAKRIAQVNGVLRKTDMGDQLYKLGYTFEQQAELVAGTSANLQASGKLESMSREDVARATTQYGKDLKVLADITGKDAKQAAEKARTESLRAAVYGKLDADQRDRLQKVLRGMPEELQKGFLENIATGGTAITDTATLVAMQANQQIGTSFGTLTDVVMQGSRDGKDAQAASLAEREKMGKAQLEADKSAGDMYRANLLVGGNAAIEGATKIGDALTQVGVTTIPGASEKVKDAVEIAANNTNKLDVTITTLDSATEKAKVAMETKLTPMIGTFVNNLLTSGEYLTGFANAVLDATNFINKKLESEGGGEEGGWAAKAIDYGATGVGALLGATGAGAVSGGLGTVAGGVAGGMGGHAAGQWINQKLGLTGTQAGAAGGAQRVTAGAPGVEVGRGSGRFGSQYSQGDLAKMGFVMHNGDVQKDGGYLSPQLLQLAKNIQEQVPGFARFNSFNDNFHNVREPGSEHTKGISLDFALSKKPTREEGQAIMSTLKSMGASFTQDEYNNPSGNATGGHIHARVAAKDGAVIAAQPGGTNVKVGEGGRDEIIAPIARDGKLKLDTDELVSKLDEMIKVLKDHKDTSEKILHAAS